MSIRRPNLQACVTLTLFTVGMSQRHIQGGLKTDLFEH